MKTIKAKTHPETKKLFWLLFVGSKGSDNRIRIMSVLRKRPRNTNQLSIELGMDYKGIKHHIKILKENYLVKHVGKKYARTYLVSGFFKANESVFDEIVKLQKKNHKAIYKKTKTVESSSLFLFTVDTNC